MSSKENMNNDKQVNSWIPSGYMEIEIDNKSYVLPHYLVDSLLQDLDRHRKKEELEVEKATGTVSSFHYIKRGKYAESYFGKYADSLLRSLFHPILTTFSLRFLNIVVRHSVSLLRVW
jgi:hypothetical protein